MKVKAKAPFFMIDGLHKKGDILEVNEKDFRPDYMEPVIDEKKATEKKVETAVKKTPAKTTRKKV